MCAFCGHSPCSAGCPNYTPKVFAECAKCGEDILFGEDYADLGDYYCKDCIEDMTAMELFKVCGFCFESAEKEDFAFYAEPPERVGYYEEAYSE